jgi:hypothetical protein
MIGNGQGRTEISLDLAETTVGAGATVFLAALTVPNLIMLWRYVRDTKLLAETASEQLESSQTPFVVLMVETSSDYSVVYRLENQGGGPAMNVTGWMEWPTGEKAPFAFSRALGRGGIQTSRVPTTTNRLESTMSLWVVGGT